MDFVASSVASYDGTTLTTTLPVGVQVGDLLVMAFSHTDEATGGIDPEAAYDGWRQAIAATNAGEFAGIYWCIWTGAESLAFAATGTVSNAGGALLAYRGALPYAPIACDGASGLVANQATADALAAGVNVPMTPLRVNVDGCRIVTVAFAHAAAARTFTYPAMTSGSDFTLGGGVVEAIGTSTLGGEAISFVVVGEACTVDEAAPWSRRNGISVGARDFTASASSDLWGLGFTVQPAMAAPVTPLVDLPVFESAITTLVGAGSGEPMEDLLLDPTTGDLLFTSDVHVVSGKAAVGQAIDLRLSLVLGEWWLDPTLGVDWFGEVLVKAPNLARIESELRTVVVETLGVDKVLAFSLSLDRATRLLTVTYSVSTALGELSSTFTTVSLGAA